jgi:hypothetical protein
MSVVEGPAWPPPFFDPEWTRHFDAGLFRQHIGPGKAQGIGRSEKRTRGLHWNEDLRRDRPVPLFWNGTGMTKAVR